MAIAKYEVLGKLLKEGDYNVRVTLGNSDNKSDEAFYELIRDSIGGGIMHSDNKYEFQVIWIPDCGNVYFRFFNDTAEEVVSMLKKCGYIKNCNGLRISMEDSNSVRSWVIIR